MRHVAAGSRIVIHGDYDVDGVCSTAVLARALERLGAAPVCDLPSRFERRLRPVDGRRRAPGGGGHGPAGHGRLRDHGRRGGRARARARRRGRRDRPPPPGRGGFPTARSCTRPSAAIRSRSCAPPASPTSSPRRLPARPAPTRQTAEEDLDLVALATVCDVVPLVGENRRIVRDGLQAIARTRKPGLRALMRVASCDPGAVDAGAARLPPRAADQRRGPDAAPRRRARAAPDRATTLARARSPASSTCSTASARTPRCGSRSPPRPSWPRTPTSPRTCSPARAGTRASSGSSPRGWSSATAGRAS